MDLALTDDQEAFLAEARRWLEEHYEPPGEFESLDEKVAWGRRWQAELADGRWVGIDWPREYGGRGGTPVEVALFTRAYARTGAPQPVNRVGLSHAGPTLLAHGTEQQQARLLPPLLRAEELWCQLFSEPEAGSDLAALSTRAVPTDGGWRLSGQKVWTSYARHARWGICLARTDPEADRHRGLTCFVVDMDGPGIEIRPLVQATGEAEFSEVFLEDAAVGPDGVVGEVGDGWRVASTILAHERGVNFPVKEQGVHEVHLKRLLEQAVGAGRLADREVAESLGRSAAQLRLLAWTNLRTLSRVADGHEPGAETSATKLLWSRMTQDLSHLAVDQFPRDPRWRRQYLWSRVASIAGGTSEIQRSIVAERLLGLPRHR